MYSTTNIKRLCEQLINSLRCPEEGTDFLKHLLDNPDSLRRVATYRVPAFPQYCDGDQWNWTVVHAAAYHGREDMLQLLSKGGVSMESSDERRRAAIWYAAAQGHLSSVVLMLEIGMKLKYGDTQGWTPLHAAARNGHSEVIKLILSKGAKINHCDQVGWTPLHKAVWGGHEGACQVLLDAGANITAITYNDGISVLHLCAHQSDIALIRLLIRRGAKVNLSNSSGVTPLMLAANKGNHLVVAYLMKHKANLHQETPNGHTALHYAAENGCVKTMHALLQICAEFRKSNQTIINKRNRKGWTALHVAVHHGRLTLLRGLQKYGADEHIRTVDGRSVLHIAAARNKFTVLNWLLKQGEIGLEARDNSGYTALHIAASRGHSKCVEILLDAGCSIEARDNNGNTATQMASRVGHVSIVKLLLSRGGSLFQAFRLLFMNRKFKLVNERDEDSEEDADIDDEHDCDDSDKIEKGDREAFEKELHDTNEFQTQKRDTTPSTSSWRSDSNSLLSMQQEARYQYRSGNSSLTTTPSESSSFRSHKNESLLLSRINAANMARQEQFSWTSFVKELKIRH